jgi:uncharacterized membrane protein YraQ (UPF0718 family)
MFILDTIYIIIKEFFSLTLSVIPYFIIGTIVGALLEVYLKKEFAYKYLNKGIFSIINASLLGAAIPGCACSSMPLAYSLKNKGSSLGTVTSFIVVAPLLSPHTLLLTYAMLGFKFAFGRLIFSLSGAIIIGIVFNYFENKKNKYFIIQEATCTEEDCDTCVDETKKPDFFNSWLLIIKKIGKYFLIGMFLASLLTTLIPEEAIPKYIGSSGMLAYLTAVLIGVPLYVCEGEEIPLTLALLKLGLDKGPALSFLLGSIGTCIPTMLMARKVIGNMPTIFYILFWFIFATGSGILFSILFN